MTKKKKKRKEKRNDAVLEIATTKRVKTRHTHTHRKTHNTKTLRFALHESQNQDTDEIHFNAHYCDVQSIGRCVFLLFYAQLERKRTFYCWGFFFFRFFICFFLCVCVYFVLFCFFNFVFVFWLLFFFVFCFFFYFVWHFSSCHNIVVKSLSL